MKLNKTKIGLPNTCSICGEPQTGEWYAANDDAAFAGQGVCKKHVDNDGNFPVEKTAKVKETPAPEDAPAKGKGKGAKVPEESPETPAPETPEG